MDNIDFNLFNLIIIRYNEIWLKSKKIKHRMIKALTKNIVFSLKKNNITYHKYQYTVDFARILFFFKNLDINRAVMVLRKVFGIHSISPAIRTSSTIKNIINRTIEVGKKLLDQNDTFAIRARRSGKHEFSSQDIAKQTGSAILNYFKDLNLSVNLSNPKKRIFIEVRENFTYIFTKIILSDWGGLPIENSKHVLNMNIGRLTDYLATFLLMKRGCKIHPILFNLFEDKRKSDSKLKDWEIINNYYNDTLNLKVIEFNPILKKIFNSIEEKEYICALCNLARLKIIANLIKSNQFLSKIKIRALTVGINLTDMDCCPNSVDIESLSYCYEFLELPIFTACIGLKSNEIKDLLNKISPNLKKENNCPYCPKNQKYDFKKISSIFISMNLDGFLAKELHKIKYFNI